MEFSYYFQLMNDEFEIISQARVPSKIDLAVYNNNTGEIITFSHGYCVVSMINV